MGKKNKDKDQDTGKKDKSEKKDKKESAPEFKFGVSDLAEKLGIEPASVRVQLRNRKVEKAGKSYGWNTQKEFDAVAKQLSEKPAKADKAEKGAKSDDGDKPKKDKKDKKNKKDKKAE